MSRDRSDADGFPLPPPPKKRQRDRTPEPQEREFDRSLRGQEERIRASMRRQQQQLTEVVEARKEREAETVDPAAKAAQREAEFDDVLTRLFARLSHMENVVVEQAAVIETHASLLEDLHHHATYPHGTQEEVRALPDLHVRSRQPTAKGKGKNKGQHQEAHFVYEELSVHAKSICARKSTRYYCIACAERTQSQSTAEDFNLHCQTPYHKYWRDADGCPTVPGPHRGSLPQHTLPTMAWKDGDLKLAQGLYNGE